MEPFASLPTLTRENYETMMYYWQFFPIVRQTFHPFVLLSLIKGVAAHSQPMGHGSVSDGQDQHTFTVQR